MTIDSATDSRTLREWIVRYFDTNDLDLFIRDHFPEFRAKVARTAATELVVAELVDYCDRYGHRDQLIAALRTERPGLFAPAPPEPLGLPDDTGAAPPALDTPPAVDPKPQAAAQTTKPAMSSGITDAVSTILAGLVGLAVLASLIWNTLFPSATADVGGVGETATIGDVNVTLESAAVINNQVQAHWTIRSSSETVDARDYMNSVEAKDAGGTPLTRSKTACDASATIDCSGATVPLPSFTSLSYTDYFTLTDGNEICGQFSFGKKAPGSTKIYIWRLRVFCP